MFRRSSLIFLALLWNFSAWAGRIAFFVGSYKAGSLVYCVKKYFPELRDKFFILTEESQDEDIEKALKASSLAVVDVMIKTFSERIFSKKPGVPLFCVNFPEKNSLSKKGCVFDEKLLAYYSNPTEKNTKNLIAYTLRLSGEKIDVQPPEVLPAQGIYHPDLPRIFESFEEYKKAYAKKGKYWVVVLFYQAYLDPLHRPFLDALIRKLEEKGINVAAVYSYPAQKAVEFVLKNRIPAELIISFVFKMSASVGRSKLLEKLNVPVINALNLFSESIKKWKSSSGLSPLEVSWQLAIPEISGLIEPVVVAGRKPAGDYSVYSPIDSEVEFLVSRVLAWIRLRHKPNHEKRVAIIYYNHSPGRQSIGASYLNTFRSISVILKALKERGYRVEGDVSEKRLKELLLLYGRNVGSWAPGELKKIAESPYVVKLPISVYKEWFSELPESFRSGVLRDWGPPENATVMRYRDFLIIPGVKLGNVFIAPQPARGVAGDAWKMYHSLEVYPPHQYVAFYLWLKKVFKADAVVHLGTHGTLEWLPGKETGLSSQDPSYFLLVDMVDIYPYVVDDVGEGIQAKRRGLAVVVDHLTPPMVRSGLYGDYARLSELISQFEAAGSERIKKERLVLIKRLVKKLGIDKDLGIREITPGSLESISHYLISIKEDLCPYGLHTFGVSPKGKIALLMAKAVGTKDALKKILASGESEMKGLFSALSGGYVPPKTGNDPVRNPDAVPTGFNFYAFDPEKIPSPSAWRAAKKLVDRMLENYVKRYKSFPRKVSVILWATETIRNEGINEAQILYLLGMRPVWDEKGRVEGIEAIPGNKLGRPRIDVLIHASGLYRDMFGEKLRLLDEAVRKAALLKDVENFVSKNAEELEKLLLSSGVPKKKAEKLSLVRIFSEKPGDYGTGVSLMTANTGFWTNSTQIASVFINRTSFAYGMDLWGKQLKNLYKLNLSAVDAAVHSISSNLYRALDNDDVFQYLGGVALAVKALRGRYPEVLVARSKRENVWLEGIERTLSGEMTARYFNPKWIRGMMKEGYAGAREMSKFFEFLWGWQVTVPFSVRQNQWLTAFEIYVRDKYGLGLRKFFEKNNPWAFQAILAWMLEAIRKGYWRAPERVKFDLARLYVLSVAEKGVACCEHTCNNPFLNQFVANLVSIYGLVPEKTLELFKKKLERATGKSLKEAVRERSGVIARIAESTSRILKGMELVEEKRRKSPSTSGVAFLAIFFSALVSLIFVLGFRRAA